LPREEWAKPRGRKSHRRRCGTGDRGADVLWPDQAIRGPVARVGPTAVRRRRGGNRVTRTRGRPHGAKEKKPLRTEGRHCMFRPRPHSAPHGGSCRIHRGAASVRSSAAATALWSRLGGDQRPAPSTTTLETTNGEGSALIGQRRQLMRRCHAGGNALSGVGRGAESTMRSQAVTATMIAPATATACRQPSAGMPTCARPSAARYPATAAGTTKRSAITARMRGERSVVKAICPTMRVMLLAIAPTMIAAIGPEPL
jgi:hypothetical protein